MKDIKMLSDYLKEINQTYIKYSFSISNSFYHYRFYIYAFLYTTLYNLYIIYIYIYIYTKLLYKKEEIYYI